MSNSKNTVIPPGFKVTKCPPGDATKVRSNYSLLREEERALERGFKGRVDMINSRKTPTELKAEQNAAEYQQRFNDAIAAGKTIPEALAEANRIFKKE